MMTMDMETSGARIAELESLVAAVQTELASSQARVLELEKERDILRRSHERLRLELELLKKRIFVAKAERVDTKQLELEFQEKLRQLDELAGTLGLGSSKPDSSNPSGKRKHKPTGRRDVRDLPLEEERIELTDPVLEELVLQGRAVRHGVEESVSLKRQRGGLRRVVVARVKYRSLDEINDATGALAVTTTPMPPVMFKRCIAAPSLIAHIASRKFYEGMPLFRIDQVSFNATTNCWDINWDQLGTAPSGVSFSRTYVPGTHETLLVYVGSNGALQQASLSAAGLSWQYVRPSLLASGAGMSSGVSPSLATINGDVWMAITHPSTNAIQLYRLEAGAIAAARRWTLMATYGTTTTRPALVATRNLDNPSQWEFSLLYSHSLGYLAYARSSPSALTSFVNLGSFYGNQTNVSSAAAVWDERSYIGDWPDFRVWRRVSRTCRYNADRGSGSVCTSILNQNVCTVGGMVLANTEMTPFSRGPAMGVYADYDEWRALKYGFCASLAGMSGFAPPGFNTPNCGPVPAWDEPGFAASSPPSANDAVLYPELYETREVICD